MTNFHLFIFCMAIGLGTLGLGLLSNSAALRRKLNNKYRRLLRRRELRSAVQGRITIIQQRARAK